MTAPETSFRPKTRNLPKKDKSLAPLESLRPVTRSDAQDEKNQMNEAFGNLEFRADMDKQLSWNPLARLGFNPNKTKVLRTNKSAFDARISDADTKEYQLSLIKKGYPEEEAARVEEGDIVISADAANNPTIAHEYTHKGLSQVYALADKDPNLFMAKYGEDSLRLVLKAKPFRKPMRSLQPDEYLTELFDDVNTMFNSAGIGDTLIQREKFPNKNIKFTVSSSDDDSRFIDTRSMLQEKLKGTDKRITEKSITNYNKDIKGIFGIMEAAQDILTEQGEPPKSKVIELSLFNKIKKKLGFAEGGSVNMMDNQMRMFEEGGIADDGMNRDPISGNEVPPGSLAREVRDDVPAQLSDGEYVVPADVVRFFGVRVFEEMRMEAKMGLQQMEQNGRIGGEPATATAPPPSDDLSPAEEQLLQEIMAMEQAPQQQGMAEGGVVNAAYGISVGEGDGLTEDITVSTGGPAGGGGSNSGMREVFFIHPDGRRIKVLLLNDTPIGKVPEDFDTFVTDTPENRVEIDFKDTTGETGSGVGTASGVDSRGGSGDAIPGATGRNSVAVGEAYTKPNGETATRMPDEYYMAGGQSDENRRNQEFFDSIGEEAPEKTIEDTGINYADPTAGATDALSAGKNELMQLGAGLFPLLGVINSGVQAKAISKANANAIIALRKGDTEVHAAIIKQIETYQNVHSSVLADAGTWFAGLFVEAGQNRVDDFDEITGDLYNDFDEGFKRVDVAPTSSPLNEEQKEKRLEALKEEYEKNKAKEEASKSREQRKAEKERKAAEAERVKQQKIVREKRQREVSEANRIKEGVKLAADAAAAQAAAYQAAVAANNDNDKGGGSGLGSANNSGLGYAAVTGFGKADGPGGQGFVNRAYAAEGGLVSRPKKKKK